MYDQDFIDSIVDEPTARIVFTGNVHFVLLFIFNKLKNFTYMYIVTMGSMVLYNYIYEIPVDSSTWLAIMLVYIVIIIFPHVYVWWSSTKKVAYNFRNLNMTVSGAHIFAKILGCKGIFCLTEKDLKEIFNHITMEQDLLYNFTREIPINNTTLRNRYINLLNTDFAFFVTQQYILKHKKKVTAGSDNQQ